MLFAFITTAFITSSTPSLPSKPIGAPISSDMPAEIPPEPELPRMRVIEIDPKKRKRSSGPYEGVAFWPDNHGKRPREQKNTTSIERNRSRHQPREQFP